ncbi:MAG: alginate lyase family protein [bacterium]
MKSLHHHRGILIIVAVLCLCFSGTQKGLAFYDDFNRPGVGYTNVGNALGWYWQCSGGGCWSRLNHEVYVNNSDSSLQTADQVLYNTRVALQSGHWSASVDVRDEKASRRVGMVFMVSGGGTNHYQIRLLFGAKQVQVLKSGAAGNTTIYSSDTGSSEVFNTGKFYTVNAWSTNATRFNWSVINSTSNQVAGGSFTDAAYTDGYAGVIKTSGDGNSDIAHFDNFYVREITVPPITQPHPRLLVTPADITEIQGAIAAHIEPRYSAWLNLKSRADSWCQNPVSTPYTGQNAMAFFNAARGAGHAASKMALAYLLNGNAAHAAKAKEILLAWAQATPRPGTDFPSISSDNFVGGGMLVARGVNGLVYAYDYLYNDLTPAERTVVESWFRDMLPVIRSSIDRWNAPFERSSGDPRGYVESSNLDNIYFYGQLYQNHVVSNTMGWLLFGYALGDQELVQFAVDSKDNPRSYLNLFEGNILMSGETSPDSDTMTPAPQDGEIYDRSRHADTTTPPCGACSS